MKKIITEIFIIPLNFLVSFAFAWVPMLAWNNGVHVVFPNTPVIGYFTAFWLCLGLNYLRTSVVPIKE